MNGLPTSSFKLILQSQISTSSLTFTSTGAQIASALSSAANALPSSSRQCSQFSVTSQRLGTNTLKLTVQFLVENSQPLTTLGVYQPDVPGMYILLTILF